MGGMRNNQGGDQPGHDEPGPAELQQRNTDQEAHELTSSEVDEARLKSNLEDKKPEKSDGD
jgi:hypothetical protein